jgi:hypothetical protein
MGSPRRSLVAFGLLAGVLALCVAALAADDKGKNKAKGKAPDRREDTGGTIWHYKLSHDGRVETGTFRVHRLEIFHGKEKIGVVKVKDQDESGFRVSGFPELNGEATFEKVKGQPGVAKGTLLRPNGQKWDLELEIKDR